MLNRSFRQGEIPDVRKGIRNLLFVAAPTLLALILSSLRGRDLLTVVQEVDWRCIGAIAVLSVCKWVLDGLRLSLIVRRSGHEIPLWRSTAILVASIFGANVTPFYAGGLATQVYFLTDASLSVGQAGAVGAAYGTLNLMVNLILSIIVLVTPHSVIHGTRHFAVVGLAGAMAVCAGFLFLVARCPDRSEMLFQSLFRHRKPVADRACRIVRDFATGMASLVSGRGASFPGLITASLVSQTLSLLFAPLAFGALRMPHVAVGTIMLTQAGVQFSSSIGATPGGVGIVEAVFAFFFAPLCGKNTAGVTLLWRLGTFYFPTLVGAGVFMALLGRREPDTNKG
jgi:uncharacterized protein (TIRG00374 family)